MIQLEEQKKLIENFVKSNSKFPGNEDLLERFCDEAFQKAYLILSTSDNIKKTETYVSKIVNTTMMIILKSEGRLAKVDKPVEENEKKTDSDKILENNNIQNLDIEYDLPDPKDSIQDIIVKRDLLEKISDIVCIIHKELPGKLFYDIFYLRYVENKKQSEISKALNISQAEVSKRILHLSKLISAYLYQ